MPVAVEDGLAGAGGLGGGVEGVEGDEAEAPGGLGVGVGAQHVLLQRQPLRRDQPQAAPVAPERPQHLLQQNPPHLRQGLGPGQPRGDLLQRPQPLLGPPALGDVDHGDQHEVALGGVHRVEADLHGDLAAVLAQGEQLPPRPHRARLGGGHEPCALRAVLLAEALRHQVFDGHAQQFLTAVAEQPLGLGIGQHHLPFAVDHQQRVGDRLDHLPEALLGQPALGDVDVDPHHAQRLAVGVVDDDGPAAHPAHLPARQGHAVLELARPGPALPEVGLHHGADAGAVVGVDALEEGLHPAPEGAGLEAQQPLEARRPVVGVAHDVPLPPAHAFGLQLGGRQEVGSWLLGLHLPNYPSKFQAFHGMDQGSVPVWGVSLRVGRGCVAVGWFGVPRSAVRGARGRPFHMARASRYATRHTPETCSPWAPPTPRPPPPA